MASTSTITPKIEVDEVGLDKHYLTLTECQKPFIHIVKDWIKRPRKLLVVVSGRPGTGKSYVVKNTFNYIKTLQLRMSFTARSAASIGGKTIHFTLSLHASNEICKELEKKFAEETDLVKTIKQSRKILKEFQCAIYPSVVIADEISMINGWFMYWIIRYFMDRTDIPLIFICMGDLHQLNPVKSIHNLFSFTFTE